MSSDEDACDICDGDKSSKKNPIIFCDGEDCNLPVHKMCYKVDEVPEDDWFCQRCDNKMKNKPVKMVCCLTETGAARHTVTFGDFMHVVCALWNKEIDSDIEPYSFNKKLLHQRKCYLCDKTKGLCVKCEEPGCSNAFHVTCGINNGLITPAITVPLMYSTKCAQHQPMTPTKKPTSVRRRLLPGSMLESSSSDESSDPADVMIEDGEEDEDELMSDEPVKVLTPPVSKAPTPPPTKQANPPPNKIAIPPLKRVLRISSDEEDDMGTSKKSKYTGGSSYRDMFEAKRKKSTSMDAKRLPLVPRPPVALAPRPPYRPTSGPSSPIETPAERPVRPSEAAPALAKPTLGRPEKQTPTRLERPAERPRWNSQPSSQPTTPSIANKTFFDGESNGQKKPSEGGNWQSAGEKQSNTVAKLREDFHKVSLEKDSVMRTLNKMTDEFNRLRDEKKRWISFRKNVCEVFAGLNCSSPLPTPDTIEQHISQIQSLIQRHGPITDEESVMIESACKNMKSV
ncbi:hypothetical protein BY458DRAFT_481000 [Sporodiniella umbellata]|nr:hypothetical protein BY458DRAFT_481000 [Sporodiniella umbellata]